MESLKQKSENYKISLRRNLLKKMLCKKRKILYYSDKKTIIKKNQNLKVFQNAEEIIKFFKSTPILLLTLKPEEDLPKIKKFFIRFYKTINKEGINFIDLLLQIFQKLKLTKNYLKFLIRFKDLDQKIIFYVLNCLLILSKGNEKLINIFLDFIFPISKIIIYYKNDEKIISLCFEILGCFLMANNNIKKKMDSTKLFEIIFKNLDIGYFDNNESFHFFLYHYFTQLEYYEYKNWIQFFGIVFLDNFFKFENLTESKLTNITQFFSKYSELIKEEDFFSIFEINEKFIFSEFVEILILLILKKNIIISSFCLDVIVNITSYSDKFLIKFKILEILDKNEIVSKLEKIINKDIDHDVKILKIFSNLILIHSFFIKVKKNKILSNWIFLIITKDKKKKNVHLYALTYLRNYFYTQNKINEEKLIKFVKNNKYLLIGIIRLITRNQSSKIMLKIYSILDIIKNIHLNYYDNLFYNLIESDETLKEQIKEAFFHPNQNVKQFFKELLNQES